MAALARQPHTLLKHVQAFAQQGCYLGLFINMKHTCVMESLTGGSCMCVSNKITFMFLQTRACVCPFGGSSLPLQHMYMNGTCWPMYRRTPRDMNIVVRMHEMVSYKCRVPLVKAWGEVHDKAL